jgi:hypothetical protein
VSYDLVTFPIRVIAMLVMAFCVEFDVSSATQPDPIFRLGLNGTVGMISWCLMLVQKQSRNMPPPMSVRLGTQEPACIHLRMRMLGEIGKIIHHATLLKRLVDAFPQ